MINFRKKIALFLVVFYFFNFFFGNVYNACAASSSSLTGTYNGCTYFINLDARSVTISNQDKGLQVVHKLSDDYKNFIIINSYTCFSVCEFNDDFILCDSDNIFSLAEEFSGNVSVTEYCYNGSQIFRASTSIIVPGRFYTRINLSNVYFSTVPFKDYDDTVVYDAYVTLPHPDAYVDENDIYYQWCYDNADNYIYSICYDVNFGLSGISGINRNYVIYFTPADKLQAFAAYEFDDSYLYNKIHFKYAYRASVSSVNVSSVYEAFYKAVNFEYLSVTCMTDYSSGYVYNTLSEGIPSLDYVIYSNRALFYNPSDFGLLDKDSLYINKYTYEYMESNGYNQENYYINPIVVTDDYDGFVAPEDVVQPNAPTPTPIPSIDAADTNGDGVVDENDNKIIGWLNGVSDAIHEIVDFFRNASDNFSSMILALFIPDAEYMESLYLKLVNGIPVIGDIVGMLSDLVNTVLGGEEFVTPVFTIEMSQLSGPLHMDDITFDMSVNASVLSYVKNIIGMFFVGGYFFREFITFYKLLS